MYCLIGDLTSNNYQKSFQLKNKWKQMKSAARCAKSALRAERSGTGGGPKTITDLNHIDELIISFVAEVSYCGVKGGRDLNAGRYYHRIRRWPYLIQWFYFTFP